MKTRNLLRKLFLVPVLLAWFGSSAHAFYDASVGRWLNRDPISDTAFIRTAMPRFEKLRLWAKSYAFVQNSPVDRIDPEGLWVVCCRDVRAEAWYEKPFRHCDIQEDASKCDPGSQSYPIEPDPNCAKCPPPETAQCLKENKYSAGAGCWGSNCQANTLDRLKKCCLKAPKWNPNFYAYPFVFPDMTM